MTENQLAKMSGFNRSYIALMKNGQRVSPDTEKMVKLLDALALQPFEHDSLWSEYIQERMGKDRYKVVEAIKDLIESMGSNLNISVKSQYHHEIPDIKTIDNIMDLNYMIKVVIEEEARKEDGKLYLIMQPDKKGIFGWLPGICKNSPGLKIEHIVCMERDQESNEKDQVYNIQILKELFKMMLADENFNYEAYYYYDRIISHFDTAALMPSAVITSEYVINIAADFEHALVLHDEGTKQDRKNDQEEFKKGNIDILVVYNMLLTGFDAPRLKKQYLARMIKAHNLLQTLTRVNRPYKGYHYGYVVDFANIKDEFDKTNKAYFDELQSELGDEVQNYSNIFKSKEDIEKDLNVVKNQLFLYDTSNVVSFINQISEIDDKKQLLDLRQALENYKAMYNLIRLYGYEDLYEHFNVENAIKCLNEVNNRISIINLKNSIDSSEDMSQVLNMALDQIDFQFRKIKEEELIIADAFRDSLEKTRREIVDRCLDPKDPEYIALLDELKRVFKKKNIEELTADEMKQMMGELDTLKKKAEKRNLADRMLAAKYSGDVKYMRTHKRIMGSPPPIADAITVHRILMSVKSKADDQIAHNENILDNEDYFIKSLQPIILRACMGENVRIDKPQLMFIDNCLSKEYILERDWVS